MRRSRFFALCALLGSLLLTELALAASEVRSVRLWRSADNTRLVFDLSGPVRHNVFTLSAPERIVIDLEGAKMATSLEQLGTAKTPISGLRAAARSADQLRIVLDVASAVQPNSFSLAPNQQYGHRLVVDLKDVTSAAASKASAGSAPAPDKVMAGAPAAVRAPVAEAAVARTSPSAPPARSVASVPSKPPATATPLASTRRSAPLPSSAGGQRDIVIAIDAGHGGKDPGALGPNGEREKDVVLAIARELKQVIDRERGFRAELVRTGDYFIPLARRPAIARSKGADLFISVHADAAPRRTAYGASVYALSDRGATSETARWLADRENRSDLIGGAGSVSLDNKDRMLASVLLDLSMTATLSSSLDVGQKVLSGMGRIAALHKRRVEQAGFMVLKSPDIPSILVETGFISNPEEARKLKTRAHQQALARSIHSGVRQFFHENPPPGSYIAWLRDQGKIRLGEREHLVAPGETLALLAQRYQVSLPALRQANRLRSDGLKVGQLLVIPAQTLAGQ
ncbi:N-acetylmuramoyl-L-alanine amidase [Pseudomonas sp. NW5]|uniref:N-acetylmuramoyl-L-alanine amidase n=1 Tax=Pseudomonas sp. NW5 TaxID=2934934 RepID=UPI0020228199|nr:N-acetylmuramoyl-L-alanine amidase [Pseudomonas sp. NW5]MCL7461123.1 N-acetylmuramoyl-L-alanine amidase [Pseudomonas sp. NW5]